MCNVLITFAFRCTQAAWGTANGCDGKVRMLADTTGAFTKALGLDLDLTAALGGVRCKRFSAVIDDGLVSKLNVEPADAPTGMTCSLADKLFIDRAAQP